jgi:hypothetical protein
VRRALTPHIALLAGSLCLAPAPVQKTSVGERVPALGLHVVLGGDGRSSLDQYRGTPVLFAWYADAPNGLNAARKALEIAEEVADAQPIVILMEVQENEPVYLRALQMNQLPGADCLLLKGQDLPFEWDRTSGPQPPVALVGVDGSLRYAGSYIKAKEIKGLLRAEGERRAEGWGAHPVAKSARATAFGAGDLAFGRASLRNALKVEPDHPELLEALEEIESRFESHKASIDYLCGRGEYARAQILATLLEAGTQLDPEWGAQAKELAAGFELPAMQEVLKTEEKLEKLLKPIASKRPKKGLSKSLRKFAETCDDPFLAARAEDLADAVDYAVEKL